MDRNYHQNPKYLMTHMAFEPNNITQEHILQAVSQIKTNRLELIPSTRWEVIIQNEGYPPREILRYAHQIMNGERQWPLSNEITNEHLGNLGFEVKEKASSSDPVKDLIEKYKKDIRQNKLVDEIYKWKLAKQFQGKPNLDAPDFFNEIKSITYANLIYPVGIAVIHHIAKERPEPYRACFRVLFDETIPLQDRIIRFNSETLKIYRELVPDKKLSHHQDERTMATFLAFFNSEKYAFYKNTFYQKYCKLIGVKSKKVNEKYTHYLDLINDFISDYLEPDTELLSRVNDLLPSDAFEDTNHKILAQDILYRMLDRGMEEIEIGQAAVYKVSMGSFSDQEIEECISNKKILVHQDIPSFGLGIESQGRTFSDKMEIGDYFYLTPDNRIAFNLLGKITGDATPAVYNGYGNEGWLERSFEIISIPKGRDKKYSGTKKWWTPNKATYCVKIDRTNLEEANRVLFEPYFMARLVPDLEPPEPKKEEKRDNNIGPMFPLNQILFGPPGTGKTYNTINKALEITGVEIKGKTREMIKKLFDEKVAEGKIVFTTFHQSMSYEDFIEGIKPETLNNRVVYSVKPGIFKQICNDAKTPNQVDFNKAYESLIKELSEKDNGILDLKTPTGKTFSVSLNSNNNLTLHTGASKEKQGTLTKENIQKQINGEPKFIGWEGYFQGIITYLDTKYGYRSIRPAAQNYVIIIDEINRGNVSQIFGELITLIEEDKRLGQEEALEVMLPYSKDKFGVPANLYIIGTMNTADRSVEALDTALRRRFSFEEITPDPHLITTEGKLQAQNGELSGISLETLLTNINKRIEKLLNKDHLIGHSYFMSIMDLNSLKAVFQNKINPLLQEYFFGDFGKIGLVIGSGFFQNAGSQMKEDADIFASFDEYDSADFGSRAVYRLADVCKMSDETFIAAINTLLKK